MSGRRIPETGTDAAPAWTAATLLEHLWRHRDALAPGGVFRVIVVRRAADPTAALQQLVRDGAIRRLRRGWYALNGADERLCRAVAGGGVLTCVSALAFEGVWTPAVDAIHVRATLPAGPLHPELRRCSVQRYVPAPRFAVDTVRVALRSAASCLTPDEFVAVADSANDQGLVRPRELDELLVGTAHRARRSIRRVAPAQSGTETLVRVRLRRLQVPVRSQVVIDGVGRVDLLVGRRLVIEVDSLAHHADPESYERDRARDLRLTLLGYRVLRFSWDQVMHQWDACETAVLSLVRQGAHL